MFKLKSIAARLILAIALTVAVACAILSGFSITQQRALTRMALDQQLKLQYESVIAAIDYEGRSALAVSSVIAALPPVGDAIAKGDRDAWPPCSATPSKALKAQGIPLITFQAAAGDRSFYRVHTPKVLRRRRLRAPRHRGRGDQDRQPIVGVEPGREALGIFGMTPIMRDGKNLANVDVGAAFGKEFVDRAKKRFGIDLAVYSVDGKEFNKLSSTFGENAVAKPDELKSVIDGAPLLREAELDGHPAAVYAGQIKNYAGAAGRRARDHQGHDRIRGRVGELAERHLILGTVAILAAAILLAFLLGRGLSRPLTAITAVMNRLSSGDTERHHSRQRTPRRTRHHGQGGRRVPPQHARSGRDARGAGGRQSQAPSSRSRRCSARWPIASRPTSRAWSAAVAKATEGMQRVAGEITSSVNGTSQRASAAAAASEEASTSVNAVAAATEELASSVTEIGRQVTHSSQVASDAVVKAARDDRDGRRALPPPPSGSATCCG